MRHCSKRVGFSPFRCVVYILSTNCSLCSIDVMCHPRHYVYWQSIDSNISYNFWALLFGRRILHWIESTRFTYAIWSQLFIGNDYWNGTVCGSIKCTKNFSENKETNPPKKTEEESLPKKQLSRERASRKKPHGAKENKLKHISGWLTVCLCVLSDYCDNSK